MRAAFHSLRSALTPTLRVSQFLEGRLTPEEFTVSGNALIAAFPTFSWACNLGPEAARASPNCLVMRDIASRSRVSDLTDAQVDDSGDAAIIGESAKEEIYDNIDDYSDPAINALYAADAGMVRGPALRLYDMFIIYDTYYACPRAYLVGRDPNGSALSPDEMMQDVMQDYVEKTATIERHPLNSDVMTISIHPCRHAQAMKRILEGMSVGSGSVTLTVESYMPAFLKMLGSMLPTLEYDYTAAVRL